MGFLNFFGIKDNVQKSAEAMADMFYRTTEINPMAYTQEQKYVTLFQVVYPSLFSLLMQRISRDGHIYHQLTVARFLENRLVNLTDLCAADLNIGAAPKHIPFEETFASFKNELQRYLANRGIQGQYIYGDNSYLTHNIVADFIERNIPSG